MGSHAGSAGPVEVEPMPGYIELITRSTGVMLDAWRDCNSCGLELSKRTFLDHAYITWTEIALFVFCAYLWTQVRRGLTESLFKVGNLTIAASPPILFSNWNCRSVASLPSVSSCERRHMMLCAGSDCSTC